MSTEFINTCKQFSGRAPTEDDALLAYSEMSTEYKAFVSEPVFVAYLQDMSQGSFMMHDYEGGGVSGIKSGATQFAGVRVNMDLVPIDLPIDVYCKPNIDRLPSLDAVLITRISPLYCLNNGISEFEFFKMINKEMSLPYTCTAGYNSAKYDDEMSRSGFFANLLPVYEREWKDGNSRWDIYRVMLSFYALRPDGINWPPGKEGRVASLKLEDIAKANGIVQENSHNAVDDVFAMIDVCRLLKKSNEKLWQYLFANRTKARIQDVIGASLSNSKPLIYISPYSGLDKRYISVVMPVSVPVGDKNECVFVDLSGDMQQLLDVKPESLKSYLYSSKEELAALGVSRPALGKFKVNQIPVVMPFSAIKDESVREAAGINLDLIKQNLGIVKASLDEIGEVLMEVYRKTDYGDPNPYIEDTVYSAGFPARYDGQFIEKVLSLSIENIAESPLSFSTGFLNTLQTRLLALHAPDKCPEKEYAEFRAAAAEKLTSPKDDRVTIGEIESAIAEHEGSQEAHVLALLDDYKAYLLHVKDWLNS